MINQIAAKAVLAPAAAPAASDTPATARALASQAQSAAAAPAQPQPQAPPANVDVPSMAETMEVVVKQIESFLKGNERSLRFSVDEHTGRTVISVRDAASGDLIRQIPGEEALRLAQALANGAKSLMDLVA